MSDASSKRPLVSVIIPTLNAGSTLGRTLDSLRRQTFQDFEVVVVDRHSTDNTPEIAKQDPRVRLVEAGPERSSQFNLGARLARGDYLYFIAGDFLLEPDLLREAVSTVKLGFDGAMIHNTSDPRISFWARVRKLERDSYYKDANHVAVRFLRKRLFLSVGGYDESLVAAEDYHLHRRLLMTGARFGWCNSIEYHLGEPKNLKEVAQKHIYYGRYIMRYVRQEVNSRVVQLSPFRRNYVKNIRSFLERPDLLLGFFLYQYVRYASVMAGMMAPFPIVGASQNETFEAPLYDSKELLQRVSVVICTRNRPEAFRKAVESMRDVLQDGVELIVVNDASDRQYDYSLIPANAKVLTNRARSFLSASRNRGALAATRELVMFVDDDNLVESAAVVRLAETLAGNGNVAVASPLITAPSDLVWYAGGWITAFSGITVFNHRSRRADEIPMRLAETRLFHSCFMVRKESLISCGGFDEVGFPMYLGEADLSEKLARINMRVVFNPRAKVVHEIEMKGAGGLLRNVHIPEPVRAYFVARNRILFMRRHRTTVQWMTFIMFFAPVLASIHIFTIIANNRQVKWTRLAGPYLRGIVDGIIGKQRLGARLVSQSRLAGR